MAAQRFTIRKLSSTTGLPYRTLQGWLLGTHAFPAAALGRIAEALGVSTDWLIFGSPAALGRHCLAIAIAKLDEMKSAANRAGHEMSLLSQAQLFADFYKEEYLSIYEGGAPGSDAGAGAGRTDNDP